MSKTRKAKVILEPDEAYVVADMVFWSHVISVYESQAEDSEDAWSEMANHIRAWVDKTLFLESEEENTID